MISQSAGMTFRFRDAEIIVGANVGASSGSISSAAVVCSARVRSTTDSTGGTSPSTARRNAATSGWICCCGRYAAIRSIRRAALTSALSAIPGIDAWPERPCTRDVERRGQLLGRPDDVVGLAAEHEPVAAALVDREVAADRVRMLRAEPREPEAVAHLLVGRRREDEVAGGLESLACERRDRDGARRDLALHVERTAAPDLVVAHLAGERRHRPLACVGEHDVGVAEEEERRPVAASADPRDEVRPLGHARVESRTRSPFASR